MKFLLDENIPNKYKNYLKQNGYSDIKRINDFGKSLPDPTVFKIAFDEKRTIVTIDKDFFEYKKQENYGIISISYKLKDPMEVLVATIHQIENDQRFENDFVNFFVRLTGEGFEITCKKKNKYKTYKCKYKNK